MTFTPREVAAGLFSAAVGMGQGRVRGGDMESITPERLATLDRTSRATEKALAGPVRLFLAEPDDITLRRWLEQVQHRPNQPPETLDHSRPRRLGGEVNWLLSAAARRSWSGPARRSGRALVMT
jgi:hypothetical protein